MHRTRTVGGIVLIATGLAWIVQGTGLVGGGSFMSGDPVWALIGAVGVAFGVAFIVLDDPGRPRPPG